MINTSLAIAASVTVAFALSRAIHRSKFDMEHIQNATLAGGVAIGKLKERARARASEREMAEGGGGGERERFR